MIPVSPVAVSDALALVHVELCTYLAFGRARPLARMVVREGLGGRLREAVAEISEELRPDSRLQLQARIGRLWCEVALDLFSPARIRDWMEQNGYTAEEVEVALRDV